MQIVIFYGYWTLLEQVTNCCEINCLNNYCQKRTLWQNLFEYNKTTDCTFLSKFPHIISPTVKTSDGKQIEDYIVHLMMANPSLKTPEIRCLSKTDKYLMFYTTQHD